MPVEIVLVRCSRRLRLRTMAALVSDDKVLSAIRAGHRKRDGLIQVIAAISPMDPATK